MLGVLFCLLNKFLCASRMNSCVVVDVVPVSSEQPVEVDQEKVFEEEEP
jgi:hypothetical protein